MGTERADAGQRWLYAGLFTATFATLLLELLDSRLLSVLTWYHLSFFAVSMAMLGTAAGAVVVFLAGDRVRGELARARLVQLAWVFALSIPITHLALVRMRIPTIERFAFAEILPLIGATAALALPFALSGALVAIALTRSGGRIGHLYAADLIGASLGCLAVVPLLARLDIVSAVLVAAAFAGVAAACFHRYAAQPGAVRAGILALLLLVGAVAHTLAGAPIAPRYLRGEATDPSLVAETRSNAFSHIVISRSGVRPPYYWAPGRTTERFRVELALMLIDQSAGTPLTRWDGDPRSLAWTRIDVTALPYHVRSGDVGIIGVGGGRDVLSAIWAGADSITAIELNDIFIDILEGSHREFAGIATRPEVELIHDEARSYLSRSNRRFDVLQMSLIDTFAATGAGAFTLSENALYTVEAWRVFLDRLKPGGIFSTSRWFDPDNVSETRRLLALCTAALLDRGVDDPAQHIVLISRGRVATLLAQATPWVEADVEALLETAQRLDFDVLVAPGRPVRGDQTARIVASRSPAELERAVAHADFDYSAPTDERPYFFNLLKPGSFYRLASMMEFDANRGGGVVLGNLRATVTLVVLLALAAGMVALIILIPLAYSGLPNMSRSAFAMSACYFASIGYGFMSIQIALLQRFSVYLGHPIYTYSIILFTMIACAGLGSLLSERVEARGRWTAGLPIAIALAIVALALASRAILVDSSGAGLAVRGLIVVGLTAPVSTLLGFCFPLGLRLVERISQDATPWMWGINGAFGVLASVLAVAVSMWSGIGTNLAVAAVLYLGLTIPARQLSADRKYKRGFRVNSE